MDTTIRRRGNPMRILPGIRVGLHRNRDRTRNPSSIGDIHMSCEWFDGISETQCSGQGQHVLIYGCLEGHIAEMVLCTDHFHTLEEMGSDHQARCPTGTCSSHIADWTVTPLRAVTTGWYREHTDILDP